MRIISFRCVQYVEFVEYVESINHECNVTDLWLGMKRSMDSMESSSPVPIPNNRGALNQQEPRGYRYYVHYQWVVLSEGRSPQRYRRLG